MSNKKLALIISGIYVGLGTIYSCLYWTGYGILIPPNTILYYFIAPVSFFPILVMFSEPEPFLYVLLSQLVAFVITWFISFVILSMFSKMKQRRLR